MGRDAERRDRFVELLGIYRLYTASPARLAGERRRAGHPDVAARKWRLEQDWLAELAARFRRPPVYRWLAAQASRRQLLEFLALEGGPDAGFDDLVATCQVGLDGVAKGELARNYWDEMGNGAAAGVHRALHRQLVEQLGVPPCPVEGEPVAAVERHAFDGLLATNHWLQPELVGALGMVELQAGPRCRLVLQAFDRLGLPARAGAFYRVHAEVDPRHGRDWLTHVVAPLAAEVPEWGPRMVRGGWWRVRINARFFADVAQRLGAA